MLRKFLRPAVGLSLLILAAFSSPLAQPFEGVITYRITFHNPKLESMMNAAMPNKKVVFIKDAMIYTRMPPSRAGGVAETWIDFRGGDYYFRLRDSSFLYHRRINALSPNAFMPDMSSYELAGKRRTIQGYDCTAYEHTYDSEAFQSWAEVTLWLAPGLPLATADSSVQAATDLAIGRGAVGIPLRRQIDLKDVQLRMTEQAVAVEAESVPDSLFRPIKTSEIRPFDPRMTPPLISADSIQE